MNIKHILTKHRIDQVKFRRDAQDFADEMKARFPRDCYSMVNHMMQESKIRLNAAWNKKNNLQFHEERFTIDPNVYYADSFSRQVRLKFNKLEREKIALELHWLKDVIRYLNGKKVYISHQDEDQIDFDNIIIKFSSNHEETTRRPKVMAFVSVALLIALTITLGVVAF